MSHEIRTPLSGLLGVADLLRAEQLTDKQREYVSSIRSSGRHLLNVINDILDFSRIESGNLHVEQIDFSLPVVLERLRSLVHPMAVERGLDLRFHLSEHSPPVLKGDPTRLKQVLLNLVGNAIKFTEKGSVTLNVSSEAVTEGQLRFRFEVRDTGIGIAPEKQAELFSAFTQADRSIARRFGGSGLGLAISKRLANAMGGEIGVNSAPGLGSVFWLEVPFELGNPANLERGQNLQFAQVQPRRVLVAEDVKLNQDILRDMVSKQGHELVFANNVAEAVALAEKEPFDVILMDIQMPVMDGVEATRRIRRLPGPAKDVPIVALTANVMANERDKYLAAGMNECLMKPIDWEQLFAALARYGPQEAPSASPVAVMVADGEAVHSELDGVPLLDRPVIDRLAAAISAERLAPLLQQAVQQAAQSSDEFRTLEADPEGLAREAHKLKGTSGTCGLTRISKIAAEIETHAREGRDGGHLIGELVQATEATAQALQEAKLIPQ
jgi:CheY-like chemotaxis protein